MVHKSVQMENDSSRRGGRGRGRGRGRNRGNRSKTTATSHQQQPSKGLRVSRRNKIESDEEPEEKPVSQLPVEEDPPKKKQYDQDCDISSLEAPTFTTLDRGPPAPMLSLSWDHPVQLIGEKVLSPRIHLCDTCSKPILIYGRMIPCKHVFCLLCARGEPDACARCHDPVVRVEQTGLGTVFMCTFATCGTACKRTYLSQRDLQAHIDHRHTKAVTPREDADRLNHRDPRAHSSDQRPLSGDPRGCGASPSSAHHIPVMTSARTNLITVPLQEQQQPMEQMNHAQQHSQSQQHSQVSLSPQLSQQHQLVHHHISQSQQQQTQIPVSLHQSYSPATHPQTMLSNSSSQHHQNAPPNMMPSSFNSPPPNMLQSISTSLAQTTSLYPPSTSVSSFGYTNSPHQPSSGQSYNFQPGGNAPHQFSSPSLSHGPPHQPSHGPPQQSSHGQLHQTSHGPLHQTSHGPPQQPSHGPLHQTSHGQLQQPSHGQLHQPSHGQHQQPSHGLPHQVTHGPPHPVSHLAPHHGPTHQVSHAPPHPSGHSAPHQQSHGPLHQSSHGQVQTSQHSSLHQNFNRPPGPYEWPSSGHHPHAMQQQPPNNYFR